MNISQITHSINHLKIGTQLTLLVVSLVIAIVLALMGNSYYEIQHDFAHSGQTVLAQKKAELMEKTQWVHQLALNIYQQDTQIKTIQRAYQNKIMAVIDAVISLLKIRHQQLTQAGISDQQIKTELKNYLRIIRYDKGNGYLFTLNFEGTVEAHADPTLDGKNLLNSQDVHG
ncbi:MAG: cache domain-containing protein, partial [Pseudomonadota bacterium]|nr:cache domain-containing protein [Pseudomonadota bacterium]